jgi:aminoglycoside 6'-N-acetyltransferase I
MYWMRTGEDNYLFKNSLQTDISIGGAKLDNIHSLKDTHLKSCAELYMKVFNAEPWNDEWTTESAYNRLNDILITPNFIGVYYEEDNEIKAAIFGNCEHWYEGMHYDLKEMFVSTELQGSGIGSKLLKYLEERLKKLGVIAIVLFTSKGNKTSYFYEKSGFCELEDMTMMAKDI